MTSEPSLEHVSENLLAYLRSEANNAGLEYDIPLTRILGGYDTFTYHFSLKGARDELAKHLVLRLFREFNSPNKAIRESIVQNVLAEQGYPVPLVFFTCTDKSHLGGAFLVMEFLPGKVMLESNVDDAVAMLGSLQARLHSVDSAPVADALKAQGFDETSYRLEGRYNWLKEKAASMPWLQELATWLVDNRPDEGDNLSICHGDFHPINILVDDDHAAIRRQSEPRCRTKISGILDWSGFTIADPAMDVANTVFLIQVPAKYLLPDLNAEEAISSYLDSYKSVKPLDVQNLDYYRALRCFIAFVDGAEGQEIWRIPVVSEALLELTRNITGIHVQSPGH